MTRVWIGKTWWLSHSMVLITNFSLLRTIAREVRKKDYIEEQKVKCSGNVISSIIKVFPINSVVAMLDFLHFLQCTSQLNVPTRGWLKTKQEPLRRWARPHQPHKSCNSLDDYLLLIALWKLIFSSDQNSERAVAVWEQFESILLRPSSKA